jgi:ribonuclease HI
LAVTGGFKTSPTDALDAAAFLLPFELAAEKWRHRALVRLASLPEEHPLYKVTKHKNTGKTRRHRSPINILLGSFNINPRSVEKILTTTRHPVQIGELPFNIRIPDSREDSIIEATNASEEIQIFSDGSAMNGRVGAAAVLIRNGKAPRILQLHLGPDDEHTVHEAELVGIILGLQLLSTEKQGSTTCMLGVDNQAAIRSFLSEMRKPGHHLAREALRIATQIRGRRKRGKYALTLRWTAGHEGLEGNELADRAAKEAAGGKSTNEKSIPIYLRKSILTNPAAIKKAFHEQLKKKWTQTWKESRRGKMVATFDKTAPSKKFLQVISEEGVSRNAASCIAQFRLKHAPVNHYLKKIGKVDSARCPACGEEDETVEHYLLSCPSYAHERWTLEQQAKKRSKPLTMEVLLGDKHLIKPLANYIEATQRFKKLGEQSQQN